MKSKNFRLKYVSSYLSKAIIKSLQNEGMTLKDIGEKMGGLTHSFISQVKNGNRNLTMVRLEMLEKALKRPLPIIFLQAIESGPRPKELERPYKLLRQSLKKSAELRKLYDL